MPARFGSHDDQLFITPRAELLRQVSGIEPERGGLHVRLDVHAGTRSTQRLALSDTGGGIVAGLWPAELMPQARYLYADGRSGALIAGARASGWSVEASPHLAFHTAPPSQRLYLDPQVDVDEYARRWEGADGRWIRQFPADEVRGALWPWLKERGYASAADDEALEDFFAILGRRGAHLRPGLRVIRRWDAGAVRAVGGPSDLVFPIRRAVNDVLGAADERRLPVAPTG